MLCARMIMLWFKSIAWNSLLFPSQARTDFLRMAIFPEESLWTSLKGLCSKQRMHHGDAMAILDHLPHDEGTGCLLQVTCSFREQIVSWYAHKFIGDSSHRADIQAASTALKTGGVSYQVQDRIGGGCRAWSPTETCLKEMAMMKILSWMIIMIDKRITIVNKYNKGYTPKQKYVC